MPRRLLTLVLAGLALAGLAACADPNSPQLTEQAHETATASSQLAGTRAAATATALVTSGPTPLAGDGPWEVAFETADGTTLSGALTGIGTIGVALAPMYPGGKEGWASFAKAAAEQGYRTLAFDFRGHGDSEGERDPLAAPEDLLAAIETLRSNGAEQIILIGAGRGGTAAIRVALQDPTIKGIAIISSQQSDEGLEVSNAELADLATPSLWLGARNDMTQQIEAMFALAGGEAKEMWIYEGSSVQGTYILEGSDGPDLQRRLLEFIARVVTG